jgi:hypothetical protein
LNVYIRHGRLDPSTGGTDLEGNEVEGWGFDGPTLEGCRGFHWTYGAISSLVFATAEECAYARSETGWKDGVAENSLEPQFESDCLRIYNRFRDRYEYFGDWGLI